MKITKGFEDMANLEKIYSRPYDSNLASRSFDALLKYPSRSPDKFGVDEDFTNLCYSVAFANVGLVRKFVSEKGITRAHTNYLEIITEGVNGLAYAASRFDPMKSKKFSTSGNWWMRQRIFRYFGDSNALANGKLEIPRAKRVLISKLSRTLGKSISDLTVDDVCKNSNLSREDAFSSLAMQRMIYLDAPVREGDGNTLHSLVADESSSLSSGKSDDVLLSTRYGVLDSEGALALVDRLFEYLASKGFSQRDLAIFRSTWQEPRNMEKIGIRYDLSRERVRQIRNRGLKLLRNYVESKHKILPFVK